MSRRPTNGLTVNLSTFLPIFLSAAFVACGSDDDGPARFGQDIEPIFRGHCNDCHQRTSASGYDFTNPFDPTTGIVGRANSWVPNGSKQTKVVDPGNVANSFIITKVTRLDLDDHVEGGPMPMHIPYLPQVELDAIRKWITDGANNDQFFAASVAPIFGTQVSLGGAAGKCTWCHYRNSPTFMSVLDVFDANTGMVGASSRYGGKIVAPGDPDGSALWKKLTGTTLGAQMPLQRPRLSAEQVQLLSDWIAAGAADN
jgi:hypothetical protein